jgi:hypothetical protein
MGFGAGSSSSCEVKTEDFPALLTEFKEMSVENPSTDFTGMDLHSGYNPSPPPFRKGRRSIIPPFYKGG